MNKNLFVIVGAIICSIWFLSESICQAAVDPLSSQGLMREGKSARDNNINILYLDHKYGQKNKTCWDPDLKPITVEDYMNLDPETAREFRAACFAYVASLPAFDERRRQMKLWSDYRCSNQIPQDTFYRAPMDWAYLGIPEIPGTALTEKECELFRNLCKKKYFTIYPLGLSFHPDQVPFRPCKATLHRDESSCKWILDSLEPYAK